MPRAPAVLLEKERGFGNGPDYSWAMHRDVTRRPCDDECQKTQISCLILQLSWKATGSVSSLRRFVKRQVPKAGTGLRPAHALAARPSRRAIYALRTVRLAYWLYKRCWFIASRFGATPNIRQYSRLNCEALS